MGFSVSRRLIKRSVFIIKFIFLNLIEAKESHTAKYTFRLIKDTLKNFEIDLLKHDKFYAVTDRAANMVSICE